MSFPPSRFSSILSQYHGIVNPMKKYSVRKYDRINSGGASRTGPPLFFVQSRTAPSRSPFG